jgi:hypothetical protein
MLKHPGRDQHVGHYEIATEEGFGNLPNANSKKSNLKIENQ